MRVRVRVSVGSHGLVAIGDERGKQRHVTVLLHLRHAADVRDRRDARESRALVRHLGRVRVRLRVRLRVR